MMAAIIKDAYDNKFGTAYETYKDANHLGNGIRLSDVKDYLNKLESVQTHFEYKKYNSFVSSKPLFEFEVDLMDMGTTVKPMINL